VLPAIAVDIRFSVDPAQMGLLQDTVGAAGVGLIITVVVAKALVQPETVATTE
jgi:hypothetical protein